jgi:hypothetical protein
VVADRLHFHLNAAIVQNQNVSRFHIFDQLLVVDADLFLGTRLLVHGSVQDKRLACLEGDLVLREPCDAQLGALQIGQQSDKPALGRCCFANPASAADVLFGAAVGKVESGDIHTGGDNGREGFR